MASSNEPTLQIQQTGYRWALKWNSRVGEENTSVKETKAQRKRNEKGSKSLGSANDSERAPKLA
ncbi:hypothetical protein KI387_022238, partial [Taxus chinensis]